MYLNISTYEIFKKQFSNKDNMIVIQKGQKKKQTKKEIRNNTQMVVIQI